jgi:hypothetical protein
MSSFLSTCPLCNRSFTLTDIAQHASICLDTDQLDRAARLLSLAHSESSSCYTELVNEKQARLRLSNELLLVKIAPNDLDTAEKAYHYEFCKQTFDRRVKHPVGATYSVVSIDVIVNPKLNRWYEAHKPGNQTDTGSVANEYLVWHGTSRASMLAIAREGFRIGGINIKAVTGNNHGRCIYTSESPNFAMIYVKDRSNCLLLCKACPCPLSKSINSSDGSHIQQLLVRQSMNVVPLYIVHYALQSNRRTAVPMELD